MVDLLTSAVRQTAVKREVDPALGRCRAARGAWARPTRSGGPSAPIVRNTMPPSPLTLPAGAPLLHYARRQDVLIGSLELV